MTLQQLFQISVTLLFVVVLIELFVALTLFHVRMWQEDRKRKIDSRKAVAVHEESPALEK